VAGDSVASSGRPLRMSCQAAGPLGAQAANTVLSRIAGSEPALTDQAFVASCVSLGRRAATFELALAATLIAVPCGILIGIVSAVYRNRWIDQVSRFFAVLFVSIPIFWLGLMFQFGFAYELGLVPLHGRLDAGVALERVTGLILVDVWLVDPPAGYGRLDVVAMGLHHLLLPALTLSLASMGYLVRLTRAQMLEVMGEDYIRTARAKGASFRAVVFKHALKNALVPVVTAAGLLFGGLLAGAVLTESIYAWPGMGRFSANAVLNLDFAAIMGFTVVVAIIVVLVNMIVDVLYAFLDPRVRLG
jgi:ABC-type dipeptide/oligopeptide/nickel transport system permease component